MSSPSDDALPPPPETDAAAKKKKKEKRAKKSKKHEKDKRKRGDSGSDSDDSDGPGVAVRSPSPGKKRQRTSSSVPADGDAPSSVSAAAAALTADSGNYLADAAAEYLRVWDTDRAAWKFKKNRQTWLLKNMWHPGMVRGPSFVVLLRYLEGLKGAARQKTLEQAQKILDEGLDDQDDGTSGEKGSLKSKSVGLVGSADPVAVEKQRKVTEKLRRIRFSRADALARLLC